MTPDIIATVTLLKTAEGGRKIATPADKFGCPFGFEGELFDCRLLLDGVGPLSPGMTATVPIIFLNPHFLAGRLVPGSRFTLWERGTMGYGIVDELVSAKMTQTKA